MSNLDLDSDTDELLAAVREGILAKSCENQDEAKDLIEAGRTAEKKLVERYIDFANRYAWKCFYYGNMDYDETFSACQYALLRAIRKSKPDSAVPFAIQVRLTMKRQIWTDKDNFGSVIQIPIPVLQERRKRLKGIPGNGEPTIDMRLAYAEKALELCNLEDLAPSGNPIGWLQEDTKAIDPFEAASLQEEGEYLESIISRLNRASQIVLRARYGMDDGIERTYTEIAMALDVSIEQVQQRESFANEELRHLLESPSARMNSEEIPYSMEVLEMEDQSESVRPIGKSGVRGVSWDQGNKKWVTSICLGGRLRFLGRFDDIDEATKVYEAARKQRDLSKTEDQIGSPWPVGKSGKRGVTWNQKKGKWAAQISRGGKQFHLGWFDDIDDAAETYRMAREQFSDGFGPEGYQPKERPRSKYPGVNWKEASRRWYSRIMHNGVIVYLGCFDTEEEAAEVYRRAREAKGIHRKPRKNIDGDGYPLVVTPDSKERKPQLFGTSGATTRIAEILARQLGISQSRGDAEATGQLIDSLCRLSKTAARPSIGD